MSEAIQRAAAAPPHPFRAAPWYEPGTEHRPCQCPRCAPPRDGAPPRMMAFRVVVVLLGGVLLPLVSLVVNAGMGVVELGAGGHALVLLSVAATLANLVLYPRRRAKGQPIVHAPPASTPLLALLLVGALLSCLTWGYLALLFLPLFPVSVIAVLFVGLGLCGLCPYGALTVSLIQAWHAGRTLARRIGRRPALALVLTSLLAPPLSAAAVAVHARAQHRAIDRTLDHILAQAPHSGRRMTAIASLAGSEDQLVRRYLTTSSRARREALAEAYLRLTDKPINEPVRQRLGRPSRLGHYLIRPWWFLTEGGQPLAHEFWRLP